MLNRLKLVQLENGICVKSTYNILHTLCEVGKVNWVSHIKSILFRYGFGLAYMNQEVGNTNIFLQEFKQRLQDCYGQEWENDVNSSSKLEYYCKYKLCFKSEIYISVLSIRKRLPDLDVQTIN